MFIKLHENNRYEYINFDKVTNIHVSNDKTCIFTDTPRMYFEVKETPEEIMALINDHRINDIDLLQSVIEQAIYEQRI